jgi:hypothetical protein
MFEVILAICLTVQNVSEPLLILTERSIMAYIAIILSENNLSVIKTIIDGGHLGKIIDQK